MKEKAIQEAQRRADLTNTPQRIYYAYGVYHVVPHDAMFYGATIAVINPKN